MKTAELVSYFNVSNPSEITWAHATNTAQKIDQALHSNTHILEVDVRYSVESEQPYLGHDIADPAEVTIEMLLSKLRQKPKGIKFDFKEMEAIEPTLQRVAEFQDELGPLIVNADVLPGPGAQKQGLSFSEVVNQAKKYTPNSILSVGWVTRVIENLTYSELHIMKMLATLESLAWAGDVTFAVRAFYVAQSWENLQKVVLQKNHTLTIWNNEKVPEGLCHWIEKNVPAAAAFIDLYDVEISEPLKISLH